MSRGGVTTLYNADGLGSTTSLYDSSATQAGTYTFSSFGQTTSTGSLLNPFRYTGREWDNETGLYYYRARYYDTHTARFLSEDPIRFSGGIDFYGYVANNPLSFLDPLGLCIVDVYFNPVKRLGITWGYHAYIVITDNIGELRKHPVAHWSSGLNGDTGLLWGVPESAHFSDNTSDAAASMNIVNDKCSCRPINKKIREIQDRINSANIAYNKLSTNSNADVTTILQELNLPYSNPPSFIFAPGWGLNVLQPGYGYGPQDLIH
jgi:RHS repeat-associated protein